MKLFIQGMRRSGTTIVYDVLCQDPVFDAWYEPFGPAKQGTVGGGSGVQNIQFAARTRALRERFCAESAEIDDPGFFNYGAPRDPSLELETSLPEPCMAYLREIVEASEHSLVKFVRMADKIAQLRELAPAGVLVHVVRDPRRVAVSQVLSRDRIERGIAPDRFFSRRGTDGLWGSRGVSEALLHRAEHASLRDPSDVERVLLAWRHGFRQAWEHGREMFGDDYLLVRHEDFVARPARELARVYARLGRAPSAEQTAWAEKHVRPPRPPLFQDAPEWRSVFERVGMEAELRNAGYAALIEPGADGAVARGEAGSP